ncbi:MAG TPA: hypothetical protein VGU61_00100 [Noviherbaspirillum sp.]|uniref:hypothetical protein n=1 Tax=Noviherbaspirillum sp. TaxID=1926288 RepID=UPI002DDC928B|nr:hypothetical protein [Noviherbaspirillum sp.]HEV2608637.1 hypothetical protein [Noviherbaspirillum sp.]
MLLKLIFRAPKIAGVLLLLALVALASSMSYAGFLVVGVVSDYFGTGRVVAGLLFGILFARLPLVRQGKLRTVGLLPKPARLPVIVALLAFCLLTYLYRGALVPVVFLGFAICFLLAWPRIRKMAMDRALSSIFGSLFKPGRPRPADESIIDVEFREKKDR